MKLVLFDIDGTLVNCGPQVRPLFASALEEVFGTSGDVDGYNFAGRTDPRIVIDLMTARRFFRRGRRWRGYPESGTSTWSVSNARWRGTA